MNNNRPTIDFADKQTAQEYAVAANSRVLKPGHQEILTRVAAGEVVDAYALNAALTEAMSSASTRLGQSMARRGLTKKIRHLAHIVQAILENHADGLPAYAGGDRSRKIEELQAERTSLLQAASDERRRLCAEIDSLKEGLAVATSEIDTLIENKVQTFGNAQAEHERVLAYVERTLLDDEGRAQLRGFIDGRASAK